MLECEKCKNESHTNFLSKIRNRSEKFKEEEEEEGEEENYD